MFQCLCWCVHLTHTATTLREDTDLCNCQRRRWCTSGYLSGWIFGWSLSKGWFLWKCSIPISPLFSGYQGSQTSSLYRRFGKDKWRKYEQQVREVEIVSFTLWYSQHLVVQVDYYANSWDSLQQGNSRHSTEKPWPQAHWVGNPG